METSTPTVRTRTRRSKGTPKAIPISPIPKIASQLERDSIEATPVKDISDVIDNDKVTPCSKSYSKRERKPRQWKNLEVQESDKKGQLGNGQKKDAGGNHQEIDESYSSNVSIVDENNSVDDSDSQAQRKDADKTVRLETSQKNSSCNDAGSEIQDVEDERRVEEKDENNEHGQDKSDKIEQGSETEPALTEAKSVAKKKSSGRKKSGVTKTNEEVGVDEVRDANSEASKTDAVDTGMKRRGRKRKAEHQNDGDSSQNFGDESLKDTSLNSTLGDKANTSSRGRKRKAAMNDSSVTNKEDKWTIANMDGSSETHGELMNILKHRKVLECKDCGKTTRFPHYYKQHRIWCGREVKLEDADESDDDAEEFEVDEDVSNDEDDAGEDDEEDEGGVGKQAEHTQLETGTGSIIEGFPIFYTGLEVWKLAWCPMPLGSKHEQILAVVGKTNPKTRFCGEKTYSGPGVIQIWCTGVTCNSRLSRTAPRQLYTLVHDFGLATGLKWCPTGVWQSKCHNIQADQETPLTLKVKPLLTLVPNRTPVNCGLVCTALDWDPSQGHPRILAGYTDGSVRIFNLIECSPLLKLSSEEGEKLLPVATHQIHAFPVRTVTWIASLTNIVVTSSEGLDSHFWDVENPQVPLYTEEYCCAMSSCSSRLVQGVFLASDDNYALNTNKARYRECHTLMYIGAPGQAKKRVPDILCYYLGNLYCCIWKVCETNVTFLDSKEDLNQTHICAKCQKNQSTKSLQSDSQPKISQSQKTLENGQTKECSQSEESLQNNREKTIQPDKTDKCTCSEQKKSKPCLNYMEYVDMYHRLDQVRDDVAEAEKYDQPPTYAFKAVQFNPNQLQCCWLAYGGTQGIVRLVNLFNIFPEKSKSMFTKYETG
ncbi:TF3C2-like protein [Mya arenaria]|uniref:TF3C2-like protein n=1 Tax=Mya arenaria TaxID=6604 RepID=A0ABY7F7P5_MYAAR|nr:TF3C2-like protein [Mya arenaria]